MASNNTKSISYQSSHDVRLLADQRSFVVEQRNWNRLKETVEAFNPSSNNWWANFTGVFLGMSASAFITRVSLLDNTSTSDVRLILLCVAIASLVMAILCFIASLSRKKEHSVSVEQIKKEMEFIEKSLVDMQNES